MNQNELYSGVPEEAFSISGPHHLLFIVFLFSFTMIIPKTYVIVNKWVCN